MSLSSEDRLNALLLSGPGIAEWRSEVASALFRIDLKPDNLRLWRETLDGRDHPINLLLACENSEGQLNETCLTWVVGSAIRSTQINNLSEATALLLAMGIQHDLAALAAEKCPGLGEQIPWAFYLDRHGHLTASPVLNAAQTKMLLSGNTSTDSLK